MNGTVGKLNVKITGSTADLTAALSTASTETTQFSNKIAAAGNNVSAATGKMTGGFKNAGYALNALATGAQDAASVYGQQGLSGALRAAGNNITQFASLLHPYAAVVANVLVIGGQLWLDYRDKQTKALEDSEKAFKKYEKAIKESFKSIEEATVNRVFDIKLEHTKGELEEAKPEDIQKKLADAQLQGDIAKAKLDGEMDKLYKLTDKYVPRETLAIPDKVGQNTFADALKMQRASGNTIVGPGVSESKEIKILLESARKASDALNEIARQKQVLRDAYEDFIERFKKEDHDAAEQRGFDMKNARYNQRKDEQDQLAKTLKGLGDEFSAKLAPEGARIAKSIATFNDALDTAAKAKTFDVKGGDDVIQQAHEAIAHDLADFSNAGSKGSIADRKKAIQDDLDARLAAIKNLKVSDDEKGRLSQVASLSAALRVADLEGENRYKEKDWRMEGAQRGSKEAFDLIQQFRNQDVRDDSKEKAQKARERTAKGIEDLLATFKKKPTVVNIP